MTATPIRLGSVVLDRARNKPLRVVGRDDRPAAEHPNVDVDDAMAREWGVDENDIVFDCVFLPTGDDAVSSPRKTYAYPESRLTRYPVEAALFPDDRRIHTEILVEFLAGVFAELMWHGADADVETVQSTVISANNRVDTEVPTEVLVEEAIERAHAALTDGGDEDE